MRLFDRATFKKRSAAPSTPTSGDVDVYVKTDGKLYTKDDAGVEAVVGTSPVVVKAWDGSAYTIDSDVVIFVGTPDPTSATGGRTQVNDIWINNADPVVTSLASDWATIELNAEYAVMMSGTFQPLKSTAVIRVKGSAAVQGSANCPVNLYYGQPATPGTKLYDASGIVTSGNTMVHVGQVWFDSAGEFTRDIYLTGLDISKQVTWQLMVWIVGASSSTNTMPGSSAPQSLSVTPDGTKLFATGFNTGDLSIIRCGGRPYSYLFDQDYQDSIEIDVNVGTQPLDVDSNNVYWITANYGSSNVAIGSVVNNTLQGTYAAPAAANPKCVAITPDGLYAFVGTQQGTVYRITLATGAVGTALNVGGASSPCNGIAITPDGTKLYSCHANGNVYRLSVADPPVVQTTIAVGGTPIKIRSVTNNAVFCVTQTPDNMLKISTTTHAVVNTWSLLYTAASGKGVQDFAIIPPDAGTPSGSPGDVTAFIAFAGGYWNEMLIGGAFAGTAHATHRGQLVDDTGALYSGAVTGVAVDDIGTIWFAENTKDLILKLPGAKFVCRPTYIANGDFCDVVVEV